MSSLAWMIVRGVTPPMIFTALAASGVASCLLAWTRNRTNNRVITKMHRTDRLMANIAGEVSAIRDESEYRCFIQRAWVADKDRVCRMFIPEGSDGR